VISRIRFLKRSRASGAIALLTSGPRVKLNPRNVRSCGRATALFDSLTGELVCNESRNAFHHALPRPLAANIDIAVSGPGNLTPTPSQNCT
jgi:hypothetical protein